VILVEHNKPWFVAKDVADLLGYKNTSKAVTTHCKGVKTCPTEMGGKVRHIQIINQADVIRLATRSKLPAAVKFESWIFDEVVPSVLNTGIYLST
jgi:anti-repressor protein